MHDIQVVVPDLQGREVREKVISNKETHEHPVINGPLKGERGGDGGRGGEGEGEKGRRISGWERTHTKAERWYLRGSVPQCQKENKVRQF